MIHIIKEAAQLKKWEKSLDEFQTSFPHASIFQTKQMFEFYSELSDHRPVFFLCYQDDQIIGSCLVHTIVHTKLPLINKRTLVQGGPLVRDTSALEEILESLNTYYKYRCMLIQFRNMFEWDESQKKVFARAGFKWYDRMNVVVETNSLKEVEDGLHKSKKRVIKKLGVWEFGSLGIGDKDSSKPYFTESNSQEDVEGFYEILNHLYQTKVRKPLPKMEFFSKIIEKGVGKVYILKARYTVIGGICLLISPNQAVHELYIAGMDKKYKKYYPSTILTWEAIKLAVTGNCKHFDFMGAGTPEKKYGVRDFKMQFGGRIVNHGRFGKVCNPFTHWFIEMLYNIDVIMSSIRKSNRANLNNNTIPDISWLNDRISKNAIRDSNRLIRKSYLPISLTTANKLGLLANVRYICVNVDKDMKSYKETIKDIKDANKGSDHITRGSLVEYFKKLNPDISPVATRNRIYYYVKYRLLAPITNDLFTFDVKPVWEPIESESLIAFWDQSGKRFHNNDHCIWTTKWLNEFVNLQAFQEIIIIEADEIIVNSIYHTLARQLDNVYFNPSEKELDYYISTKELTYIVRPLITRAPIKRSLVVPSKSLKKSAENHGYFKPKLEKLLTDLYYDKTLLISWKYEEQRIWQNAYEKYAINFSTIYNYAKRRDSDVKIFEFINQTLTNLPDDIRKFLQKR